jgi:prepilin-type processing-associated H-X9-DG protein
LGEENLWLQVNADDPFASFPQAQAQPQSDAAFGSGAMGVMGGPVEESPRKVFYPRLSILECPSYAAPWGNAGQAQNNYAGVHHSIEQPISEQGDGVFSVNSSESLEDLPDGRSRTLVAGEFTGGLRGHGWVFGDRSSLRNGGALEEPAQSPMRADFEQLAGQDDSEEGRAKRQAQALQVGSFNSSHPYLVNFLFADGSVRPLSKKIDVALLRSLMVRDDSAPMSEAGF